MLQGAEAVLEFVKDNAVWLGIAAVLIVVAYLVWYIRLSPEQKLEQRLKGARNRQRDYLKKASRSKDSVEQKRFEIESQRAEETVRDLERKLDDVRAGRI